jgi:hypothetical protein
VIFAIAFLIFDRVYRIRRGDQVRTADPSLRSG